MNIKLRALLVSAVSCLGFSACGQQGVAVQKIPAPVVTSVIKSPTTVQVIAPALSVQSKSTPVPYHDMVIKPASLPTLKPKPVVRPDPVVIVPVAVLPEPEVVKVPAVKAKGDYRGAVPIDDRVRQQYQQ